MHVHVQPHYHHQHCRHTVILPGQQVEGDGAELLDPLRQLLPVVTVDICRYIYIDIGLDIDIYRYIYSCCLSSTSS